MISDAREIKRYGAGCKQAHAWEKACWFIRLSL